MNEINSGQDKWTDWADIDFEPQTEYSSYEPYSSDFSNGLGQAFFAYPEVSQMNQLSRVDQTNQRSETDRSKLKSNVLQQSFEFPKPQIPTSPLRPPAPAGSSTEETSTGEVSPAPSSQPISHSSSHSSQSSIELPPSLVRKKGFQKPERKGYRKLNNYDRKMICLYRQQNPTLKQEDIASTFKIERSTVSKVLKGQNTWLNLPADEVDHQKLTRVATNPLEQNPQYHPCTPILKPPLPRRSSKRAPNLPSVVKHTPLKKSRYPKVEEQLQEWVYSNLSPRGMHAAIRDEQLAEKAREIAATIPGYEHFRASTTWVEAWKQRVGLVDGRFLDSDISDKGTIKGRVLPHARLKVESSTFTTTPGMLPDTREVFPSKRDVDMATQVFASTLDLDSSASDLTEKEPSSVNDQDDYSSVPKSAAKKVKRKATNTPLQHGSLKKSLHFLPQANYLHPENDSLDEDMGVEHTLDVTPTNSTNYLRTLATEQEKRDIYSSPLSANFRDGCMPMATGSYPFASQHYLHPFEGQPSSYPPQNSLRIVSPNFATSQHSKHSSVDSSDSPSLSMHDNIFMNYRHSRSDSSSSSAYSGSFPGNNQGSSFSGVGSPTFEPKSPLYGDNSLVEAAYANPDWQTPNYSTISSGVGISSVARGRLQRMPMVSDRSSSLAASSPSSVPHLLDKEAMSRVVSNITETYDILSTAGQGVVSANDLASLAELRSKLVASGEAITASPATGLSQTLSVLDLSMSSETTNGNGYAGQWYSTPSQMPVRSAHTGHPGFLPPPPQTGLSPPAHYPPDQNQPMFGL